MSSVTSQDHGTRFVKPANPEASGSEVESMESKSAQADRFGLNRRGDETFQFQQMFNRSPRVTAQAKLASALANRPVQRMCRACNEEEETVQTKSVNSTTGGVAQLESANRTGLPDSLKSGVEAMSGLSMDDVRVHYNSDKPAQLQAHAYTQGSDIHVAPGQEQHLAHEAWHVVQQKQGRVAPTAQLKGVALNDDDSLEKEADSMGARAVQRVADFDETDSPERNVTGKSSSSSFPVQRTRKEALSTLSILFPATDDDLFRFLFSPTVHPDRKMEVVEINNRGLNPFDPDYITVTAPTFSSFDFEDSENDTSEEEGEEKPFKVDLKQKRKFVPFRDESEEDIQPRSPKKKKFEKKRRSTPRRTTKTSKENAISENQNELPEKEKENVPIRKRPSPPPYAFRSDEYGTRTYSPERGWQTLSNFDSGNDVTGSPGQLGLATWNVAHFSNVDLETALGEFQKQFANYSSTDWTSLFSAIDGFVESVKESLAEFKPSPKVSKAKSNKSESNEFEEDESDSDEFTLSPLKSQTITPTTRPRRFSSRVKSSPRERDFKDDRTLRSEYPDIFKKLHGNVDDKLRDLSRLVADIEQAVGEIDVTDLSEGVNAIATVDWRKGFEESLQASKRAEFADKIKKLRKFDSYAEPAKKILEAVGKLKTQSGLQTMLKNMSGEDYDTLSEAMSKVQGTLPKVATIYQLGRALHSFNIRTHVDELFERNPWLETLTLQEVNDPELLMDSKEYDIHLGPELLSGGQTPQHEFYPLLTRKDAHILVDKTFVVKTDGRMEEVAERDPVNWNKGIGDYRPIVVYQIRKGTQTDPIWIGVVHTTPEADTSVKVAEFNRRKIFAEIEAGLLAVRTAADRRGIPLVIGGDYYLTAEAVVKNPESGKGNGGKTEQTNDETRERMEEMRNILEYQRDQLRSQKDQKKVPKPKPNYFDFEEIEDQSKQIRENEEYPDIESVLNERIKFLTEGSRNEQLLRNVGDLTVKKQVSKLGLEISQTISGTNPKKDPLERWFDLQIADFFIHNKPWKSSAVGLLRPEGKLLSVDTPQRNYSRYWQRFSDHFPVGGIFSLNAEDLKKHRAFVQPTNDREESDDLNIARFAELELTELSKTVNPFDREKFKDKKLQTIGRKQLALDYLGRRFNALYRQSFKWGEWDGEIPTAFDQYIIAIQEIEQQLRIPFNNRLHVTTPSDFEPNYKEK